MTGRQSMTNKVKKMKKISIPLLASLSLFLLTATAQADVVNPFPLLLQDDNNTELFNPNGFPSINLLQGISLTVQLNDIASTGGESEFGFFSAGTDPRDNTNRVVLFDSADQNYGQDRQSAIVNFNTGNIWDLDDSEMQSVFTPSSQPIGFYYSYSNALVDYTWYSVISYNQTGFDVGTFPTTFSDSIYLLAFEAPDGETYAQEAILGMSAAVPVPGAFFLFGSGLLGLVLFIRKKG